MKTIIIRYPYDRDIVVIREDNYGLENAFEQFNAGSSRECPEFVSANIRSLSVGDLVFIDGKWNRCEAVGWSVMTEHEVMNYMTAIEDKLIELRKVENDPDLPAWFAVNDVVYKVKSVRKGGRWYPKAT